MEVNSLLGAKLRNVEKGNRKNIKLKKTKQTRSNVGSYLKVASSAYALYLSLWISLYNIH